MRANSIAGRFTGSVTAVVFTGLLVLAVSSCSVYHDRAIVNEMPATPGAQVTDLFPVSLYRLATGDVLEFLYLTNPGATNTPYRLQVKDLIDIEFTYNPEMSRSIRVRPDGMISIPRKEDVSVVGLTVNETRKKLRKIYSDVLRDPEITVSLREFNAKLDELQKAITTAPYGQARVITIRPDGHISLPLIEDMEAEGLTVPELNVNVGEAYAQFIPEMKVSVLLKEIVGNAVFIDGEVEKPGVYTAKGPTTVQQVIAMAGGIKDTAEPRTVIVASRGPLGKFTVKTTDLTRATSASDYWLNRNDLIYVPKSLIAKADVWVDQNIKKLLLFQGWSFGLNYDFGQGSSQ